MLERCLALVALAALFVGGDVPPAPGGACAAPPPSWRVPGYGWHNVIRNYVAVDERGGLTWNGVPIGADTLREYLKIVPTMNPVPATVLSIAEGADCATVGLVRQEMEKALDCAHSGICGQGPRNANWDRAAYPGGTSPGAEALEARADAIENGQ
jgi:hypothetical protein